MLNKLFIKFKMNSQHIMALIVVFSSMALSEQTVNKISDRLENVGYYQLIYEFIANLSNFFSLLKISSFTLIIKALIQTRIRLKN